MEKRIITPIEMSKEMGLSLPTVYKLLKGKRIKSVRVGRKMLIPIDSLDEFLHNKK